MEAFEGGYECAGLSAGLGGASVIFGVAAWWTGVGGGISVVLGAASFAAYLAGC